MGQVTISSKQGLKLKLKPRTRLSPNLEKCPKGYRFAYCLLLVSNESFANAEQDIEVLTGVKIPHSTQHRRAVKILLHDKN